MNKGLRFVTTLGIGAGLMYFLDPNRGKRRRALVRDKVRHTLHDTEQALGKAARDLGNRTSGLLAETQHRFRAEVVSEETLEARLRSRLGHLVSHPRAIQLVLERGQVTLSGDILASELDQLLNGIASVRGVHGVDNRMKIHRSPDIPSLQGASRNEERFRQAQKQWRPGTRLLAGVAGGALTLYGTMRRNALGLTLGSFGLGLLTRGWTNQEFKELIAPKENGASAEEATNLNGQESSNGRSPEKVSRHNGHAAVV
jgi:hypothetical protein